ncbi:MAG: hypothetical protein K2Y42_00345 [Hyphomicrobium sp.]|jgi:hypothetical protein|uniref:hypothetical protein n=1 Tax=Hyphomicrobium sp. TaxID=82 RepID=UPI0025BBE6C6|nr:hypothetical protein [Hyphomicrobium sp.]MBX9861173.1 hypothetical protein [Hyphomicrobium sp.]
MASLRELRALEKQAERDWFDCLLRVDEMLSMRADAPDSGCHKAFREAQADVQVAAGRRLALQQRIAALEGPEGELATWRNVGWPQPQAAT